MCGNMGKITLAVLLRDVAIKFSAKVRNIWAEGESLFLLLLQPESGAYIVCEYARINRQFSHEAAHPELSLAWEDLAQRIQFAQLPTAA